MNAGALLSVSELEVTYNRVTVAVRGVNVEVRAGQIVALVGSNGAGKTTVLRAISGFIPMDAARITQGTVRFDGQALEHCAPHEVARRGVSIVPERDKVFQNLTIAENLASVATPKVSSTERRERESQVYEYFPRLHELRRREAGLLSGGERQMLAIAAALVARPRLLLIDELSQGLAPLIVQELAQRLQQIRKDLAITVLLVEQSAALALGIADYGYVLENGRIALQGTASELNGNQSVRNLYLGGIDGRRSYRDAWTNREGGPRG